MILLLQQGFQYFISILKIFHGVDVHKWKKFETYKN